MRDARIASSRAVAVFDALCAAAAEGAPCPTNQEMVNWDGHPCEVSPVIGALERRGFVRVERRGNVRRVTIAATGARTAWSVRANGGAWRVHRADSVRDREDGVRLTAAEIAARRVERGSCPRCGVRSDVACGHRPAPFGLSSSGTMGLSYV